MYSNITRRREELKIRTKEGGLRSGALEFRPTMARSRMTCMSIRKSQLWMRLVLKISL